ncbi:MAG: Crp/Fnr family transcriptional regulator [Flavobacteriales bacterium]|nr:Crp/Fnr family transcriptional regulator [Flavobacteriales bacterium]
MTDEERKVRTALTGLEAGLVEAMLAAGRVVTVPAGAELLKEGAYVRELPLVIDGLVRVYIGHEDKELMLYFIQPAESCVMSFSALLEHAPSRINAVTERETTLLLVPEAALRGWLREHPSLNALFFRQYNERYLDMLRTVEQVAFGDLPTRLLDHLRRLKDVTGEDVLDVRHSRLAQELGSAREVITRTLKKLEREGLLKQVPGGIRLTR